MVRHTRTRRYRVIVAVAALIVFSLAHSGPVRGRARAATPVRPAHRGSRRGLHRGRPGIHAGPRSLRADRRPGRHRHAALRPQPPRPDRWCLRRPAGTHPRFLLHHGRYHTIDHPDGTGTDAFGVSGTAAFSINNRGQVVGAYIGPDNRSHGYVLDLASGRFRTLDAPGANLSNVFGINDRGQMTLQASSSEEPSLDFLHDDGEFTPIRFPGAAFSLVHKISNRGKVVGVYSGEDGIQHGFTFYRGRYRGRLPWRRPHRLERQQLPRRRGRLRRGGRPRPANADGSPGVIADGTRCITPELWTGRRQSLARDYPRVASDIESAIRRHRRCVIARRYRTILTGSGRQS